MRDVPVGAGTEDLMVFPAAGRTTLQGAPAFERPLRRVEDDIMTPTMPASAAPFAYEGYGRTEHSALTASDLESATVYGRSDDKVGSISSLVVTTEGKITAAVVDVGGFLGIGARSVSMPFADLTVLRKTDGDDVRVYVDATKETLEAMPRHNG